MSHVVPLLQEEQEDVGSPKQAQRPPSCFTGCNAASLTLFLTRTLRMFGYGAVAPVYFLYMVSIGFSTTMT